MAKDTQNLESWLRWASPESMGNEIGKYIMGENAFTPNYYRIKEDASNRDYFNSLQGRNYQTSLADELSKTMYGQGPTVAGLQMQQGVGKALADIPSIANSARGVNRGLAFRQATLGGMAAAQQANRDAALMRAQEQLAARSQYGQMANEQRQGDLEARAQDIGIERGNQQAWGLQEQQKTQVGEGNAERGQKGAGAIMNMVGSLGSALSDVRAKEDIRPVADESFARELERLYRDDWSKAPSNNGSPLNASDSTDAGYAALIAQARGIDDPDNELQPQKTGGGGIGGGGGGGLIGGIGQGLQVGGQTLMSDRESKTGIGKVLGDLDAYRFEYREPVARRMALESARETYDDARRPRIGIMAQDLNRSKVGDSATVTTRNGEALDMKRSLGLSLAGLANLDDRLRKLERAA